MSELRMAGGKSGGRRRLDRDERQAEAIIGEWAVWLRSERRAGTRGYGAPLNFDGAGDVESRLPGWISLEDLERVTAVYQRVGDEKHRRVIELAWEIDSLAVNGARERARKLGLRLNTQTKGAWLGITHARFSQIRMAFVRAVMDEFRLGSAASASS